MSAKRKSFSWAKVRPNMRSIALTISVREPLGTRESRSAVVSGSIQTVKRISLSFIKNLQERGPVKAPILGLEEASDSVSRHTVVVLFNRKENTPSVTRHLFRTQRRRESKSLAEPLAGQ